MDKETASVKFKCLALACSPRKEGNTTLLARRALEACGEEGFETELLYLADYKYFPCSACDGCFASGRCVVRDDAAIIFEKILVADRLIMAAPVFAMGICAQAKILIDRAQQFWAARYVLGRPVNEGREPAPRGLFISCAGTTLSGVFDGALRTARYFFKMLGISLDGTLCYDGVDKKGEILKHSRALIETYSHGKILARS